MQAFTGHLAADPLALWLSSNIATPADYDFVQARRKKAPTQLDLEDTRTERSRSTDVQRNCTSCYSL